MVAFLVLSRAPPPIALLEFLRIREKGIEMFCKTVLGLKVPLYSGKYDYLILILLFIYLKKKNKGTGCYICNSVKYVVTLVVE